MNPIFIFEMNKNEKTIEGDDKELFWEINFFIQNF